MATKLLKNVSRECLAVEDLAGRRQIVTLVAGDEIQFRGVGKRMTYEVPIQAVYNLALIFTCHKWYREKMAEYNRKCKLGIRTRRPRRMARVFNQVLYEALKLK